MLSNIISEAALLKKLGISEWALRHLIKDGDFPKKIQISPRRVGWIEDEVLAWLEQRKAERTQVAAE